MKKVIRTISGITPLAVMLKPYPCSHGKCIYCPSQENVPESYTKTSPVVLRAVDCEWDPFKQVGARLKILGLMGHVTDKIELIIMGGTFSAYPEDYQEEFIKGCFDGLNGIVSESLEEAQKINETAKNRCVGMCIETRPDFCSKENLEKFRRFGCTRVEIGVQVLDDKIYEKINRGHKVRDVVNATKLLRNYGFKIGYHMMIGLPGSNSEKDLETFEMVFNDPRFKPDNIKIYPTFVIKDTKLEELYKKGEYRPYTTEQIVDLLVKIKQIVPPYIRIMRVMRDIPAEHIVSECRYSHLRDEVKKKVKDLGIKCNYIRCREVGHKEHEGEDIGEFKLKRYDYDAFGKEIFLSFEDESGCLVSLLRLRLEDNIAFVREIHTYGPQVPINQRNENSWQHKGFGTKLMKEAEKICKENGIEKIKVIAGIGVRKYFYKLGYKLDETYVSKKIY